MDNILKVKDYNWKKYLSFSGYASHWMHHASHNQMEIICSLIS